MVLSEAALIADQSVRTLKVNFNHCFSWQCTDFKPIMHSHWKPIFMDLSIAVFAGPKSDAWCVFTSKANFHRFSWICPSRFCAAFSSPRPDSRRRDFESGRLVTWLLPGDHATASDNHVTASNWSHDRFQISRDRRLGSRDHRNPSRDQSHRSCDQKRRDKDKSNFDSLVAFDSLFGFWLHFFFSLFRADFFYLFSTD